MLGVGSVGSAPPAVPAPQPQPLLLRQWHLPVPARPDDKTGRPALPPTHTAPDPHGPSFPHVPRPARPVLPARRPARPHGPLVPHRPPVLHPRNPQPATPSAFVGRLRPLHGHGIARRSSPRPRPRPALVDAVTAPFRHHSPAHRPPSSPQPAVVLAAAARHRRRPRHRSVTYSAAPPVPALVDLATATACHRRHGDGPARPYTAMAPPGPAPRRLGHGHGHGTSSSPLLLHRPALPSHFPTRRPPPPPRARHIESRTLPATGERVRRCVRKCHHK